jgi:hypothetical protein
MDGDGYPVLPLEPQALKRESRSRSAIINSKERFDMSLFLSSLSINDISMIEMRAIGQKLPYRPVFVETPRVKLHDLHPDSKNNLDRPLITSLDSQQVQVIRIIVGKEDFEVASGICNSSDAEQR